MREPSIHEPLSSSSRQATVVSESHHTSVTTIEKPHGPARPEAELLCGVVRDQHQHVMAGASAAMHAIALAAGAARTRR